MGEPDTDGECDPEALPLSAEEGEREGEAQALPERRSERLGLAVGEGVPLGKSDADADPEGKRVELLYLEVEGDAEKDTLKVPDLEKVTLTEPVAELLEEREAEALPEGSLEKLGLDDEEGVSVLHFEVVMDAEMHPLEVTAVEGEELWEHEPDVDLDTHPDAE